MDAALVTAWCTGIGGIIAALTLLVKVITTRPQLPVAEEILLRVGELEDVVLQAASYLHRQRVRAVAQGYVMEDPPAQLLALLGDPDAPPGMRRRTDRLDLPVPPPRAEEQ